MEGTVKWFDVKKGYGFLVSSELVEDNGEKRDIFVHFTKIQMEGFKKLELEEAVSFEVVWAEDGRPQADKVVRLNPPE